MTPSPAPSVHDVVVLGGGPAGASAAALLAGWGHDVALVTRATPPAPLLGESIPPSARRLLDLVGVLPRLETEAFPRNAGNTVWWASSRERSEPFAADAPGYQVERGRLQKVFQRHAVDAGVRVFLGTVRLASCPGVPAPDGRTDLRTHGSRWLVEAEAHRTRGRIELRAAWVLDATGRAGALAKPSLREPDTSTSTLALVRRWRLGSGDPWRGQTLVESYADGWAWSVPVSEGERCVTAMVDPRLTELERRASLDRLYAVELAKTIHLSRLISGGEPLGGVWACPSSLYTSSAFGGPGFLLVGDAGSFIDPLSSYGVKKAVASGWLSAVTAHTSLLDPSFESDARAFHERRERAVYRSYRHLSAPFFRDAALAYGHPFWQRRAQAAEAAGGPLPAADPADRLTSPDDDAALPGREAVEAAWHGLRDRARLEAEPGSTLRTVRRAALDGNRIVMADHLVSDAFPAGIRWVRGVPLPDLVRSAPAHATVPDLFETCARSRPGLSLPAFLTALSTAFAAGFLERSG